VSGNASSITCYALPKIDYGFIPDKLTSFPIGTQLLSSCYLLYHRPVLARRFVLPFLSRLILVTGRLVQSDQELIKNFLLRPNLKILSIWFLTYSLLVKLSID